MHKCTDVRPERTLTHNSHHVRFRVRTMCEPSLIITIYGPGRPCIKNVHWVTPYLIKHTQDCHGSTMSNVTLKHTPVRNRAPLTARSCSLWYVSVAEHQTVEQHSKTGRIKPRKHLPRSDLSWNTRQDNHPP